VQQRGRKREFKRDRGIERESKGEKESTSAKQKDTGGERVK